MIVQTGNYFCFVWAQGILLDDSSLVHNLQLHVNLRHLLLYMRSLAKRLFLSDLQCCLNSRSYKLMETILKVYIYPDGKRPIFHQPHLVGIYASEGWFMKLMEENRKFVTRDPNKAHLFYLPYSARQLETALYVPNSHNMRPLSIFLRDHVNMIAAKYPFWNRTHGSDHFLVACHDWVW